MSGMNQLFDVHPYEPDDLGRSREPPEGLGKALTAAALKYREFCLRVLSEFPWGAIPSAYQAEQGLGWEGMSFVLGPGSCSFKKLHMAQHVPGTSGSPGTKATYRPISVWQQASKHQPEKTTTLPRSPERWFSLPNSRVLRLLVV